MNSADKTQGVDGVFPIWRSKSSSYLHQTKWATGWKSVTEPSAIRILSIAKVRHPGQPLFRSLNNPESGSEDSLRFYCTHVSKKQAGKFRSKPRGRGVPLSTKLAGDFLLSPPSPPPSLPTQPTQALPPPLLSVRQRDFLLPALFPSLPSALRFTPVW